MHKINFKIKICQNIHSELSIFMQCYISWYKNKSKI